MHSIIRVLDEITINQIAAGEVIENPASVIKELIENALDADATHISIEIKGSGRHEIRVTDNGIGMNSEDARLSLERHATSKVAKIEDLDSLSSMGFRGEALPSIASISKMRLLTRPRDQELGTFIEIEGGKVLSSAKVPCEAGTTIEVQDLFYNVPARRKFLKSPKSDLLEIQKMVTDLASGNLLVHFQLISDGEEILDIPMVSTHLERAKQLLHESLVENMIPFEFSEGEIHMQGLLSTPMIHRPNRTGQALFVNQRPVFSWDIAHAVLEGYGTSLPERRFPLFHLYLTLPPHLFDINVHPQKKEVRFAHVGQLKEIIKRGVLRALNVEMPQELPSFSYSLPPVFAPAFKEPPAPFREPVPSYFEKEQLIPLPSIQKTSAHILACIPYYVLIEGIQGIQLIDVQRAKKRIYYESIASIEKQVEKQLLLLPLSLSVSPSEAHFFAQHLELFETMGFTLKPTSQGSLEIQAIPTFTKESQVEQMLINFCKGFSEEHTLLQKQELTNRMAKSAVQYIPREAAPLSRIEAEKLVEGLFACGQPKFTPSGKKIIVAMSWEDLGRLFE